MIQHIGWNTFRFGPFDSLTSRSDWLNRVRRELSAWFVFCCAKIYLYDQFIFQISQEIPTRAASSRTLKYILPPSTHKSGPKVVPCGNNKLLVWVFFTRTLHFLHLHSRKALTRLQSCILRFQVNASVPFFRLHSVLLLLDYIKNAVTRLVFKCSTCNCW
jgi:hypothetical protein